MIVPMEIVNHFKDCSKCDSIDIQDIEGCIRALVEGDRMTNQLQNISAVPVPLITSFDQLHRQCTS